MKRKHLLLTLLLALFVPWAANAQVMMLFSEDFEGGTMPSGWTQEYINGTASWSVATGDISTSTGAGQGTYNAKIQIDDHRGYCTRLITPVINLSSVAGAELSFMHIERNWGGDIDELRVYYRSSSSGAWTLIPGQVYTAAVPSWTTENEIFLPNISSTYQIAFEFTSRYGYGVGLDDIRIVTGPSCPKPSALTCSNITTTTATLSWTENGSANDWVIQCCIDPEFMCGNAGLFNVSGTPSFTITSFEPGTTYYARVKSSCGGNGESYWSNVVSFTTKHITIVVGNGWSDNFEGSSCNWELINGSQTNQWTLGTATNNGGSKALYVSNDSGTSNAYTNNVISIVYATKTLTFETAQYFFDYDWKANGESNYDYLRAWLAPSSVDLTAGQLPDGTTYLSSYIQRTPEGWISLDGGGKLNLQTEWQTRHEAVNLTAGDYVVVFMWGNDQSSGTNPPAAIDNFSITKVTCPAPIDLIASNITDNSATISWTETGQATNWLLECCTTNDFTCETSFTVSNTPSFNLTSLAPATVYYVRVQALCGDEDDSEWSDVYSFATVTEVGDYWADDFEGSSCSWQFVNGDLANQWVWGTATHHNEGSHSIYISRDGGTTNTFDWSESCTVYATKLFHFTDDRYNFSYYWKLGGLEGWASLRVALVPASTTLTASEEVDFYYFPNDWIALDGGEELWTNYNNPSWKHENRTINVPAGNYYLALIWQNSSSAFNPNPPAAVDNFSITRDVCPHDAENVTVEWTTQNSARLVWNGDGSAYEIAYCPFPFNSSDYQLAYSGGTVIELPDLDYGTTYEVKVRAWCDSDHQGFWSDDVYFTTACPEYSLPYNQNFDDCVAGDNLLPRCWNYINECTENYYKVYPKVSQSYSHDSGSSGNKLQFKSEIYLYSDLTPADDPQPQYAILPALPNLSDLIMTLWARAEDLSNSGQFHYNATFKVGVMTDPADASTFTQVETFTPTTLNYEQYTIDFSNYTGNGQHIAIMVEAAEPWGTPQASDIFIHSVYIDDVRVFSHNPVPANLTVSDITTTSAQITWTPGGEEETWQVAYKRAVDANWTEIADLLDHPSYGFSGLDPDTEYEVKVRAKMEGTFFNWTEPLNFTTEPICAIPIGLQMIEGSATCQGATVEWVDNGDDFTLMMGPVQFTNYFACFFAGDPGDQIPSDFTTTSAYGFVTARDGERTCAKSNNGGQHNTTADMVLSITVPMESDLSFAARVSSEANYDKAYFSIDGDVQDNFNGLSGDGIWYAYSYTLSAGTHELRWYYQKDVSVSNFGDCLYVGDLTISSYVVDDWTSFEHASSPYTFTGLASNSLYWTKVIRNCSPTNHSEDSYVAGFLTLPCQAPTNLTIDEVTTEYVAFTFDSELGAYYQYCIVPDGNDPIEYLFEGNTSGPASSTTFYVGYGLLGMHPDTDYRIYVRRKCGDGDFSDVVSVTFHTLNECAAYPTFSLPYTEDFEYVEGINLGEDPTENNLPMCWDYINTSSDETMKYYPVISYSNQNNFLFFSSMYAVGGCVDPQPQYALLPPVEDVSILKMSFRAKTITNFRGTFSVGVMEGTDVSTFEEMVSFDASTSFQDYTVTFENYTGTGKRIAIMGIAADDSHRRSAVSIDDIVLELNCDTPTDLIASNISSTTADLSWTGSPAAESYTVRYREINVGEPTFTEGFENGLGDWVFYSANQANDIGGTNENHAGIFTDAAHSGDYGFRFSSYYNANQGEDYWQYLTSPEFELSGPSTLSFYYRKLQEYAESLFVGYIDSNNEIIYTSQDIHPTQDWQLYVLDLPVEAKKVFFSYYGDYIWYVYLDDISISPASPWIEVTDITSTNSTLSGLSLNTEYQAQVKGDCSIDDWSDAVTFTTQGCTYPVPSTWDFDDVAVGQLPLCWTRMGSISNWPMVNSYYPYSGSRDLEFYHASADDETFIAVMPAFAADLNTLSVEFYGKQTYGDEPAYIEVGYMTDLNDVGSFVNAKTFYMTDTYEKYTAFFNNAPTDGFIAFQTTYLNQRFAIVIDDVTVKELECEAVTNLQVTETGSKYITLNWDGQDDADFYIYYTNLTTQERLRTPGAVRPPYTLEDLSVYTTYQIEVTAECNVVNSNPYNLDLVATMYVETTFCPAPTDVTVDIIDATSATVSWTGSSEAESYTLGYRSVAVAGDNPIFTQGFEEGMGDWIIGNESIGNPTCAEISAEAKRSGNYGFKLAACEGEVIDEGMPVDGLFLPIQMTEPTVLKFYYRRNTASSSDLIVFRFYSYTYGGPAWLLNPTDEWQLFTMDMPDDANYIEIDYYNFQGDSEVSVYIDDITISPVAQPAGEWQLVSDIETTSTTLTDLVLNTEYEVRVTSDCSYGGDISVVFFTMEEPTAVQTLNLSAGVNWVSFYVETTLDDLKTALLGELNNASGIKITSQSNGFTSWNGSSWRGSLNSIDVSQMYVIEVPYACEITLEAMLINPAEHSITIVNGINWIGFPFSASMSLTNAFSGVAVNGDKVMSLTDGSANYQGSWSGGLSTLQPGKGYKLEVTTTAPRTLIFPTGAKKATPFNPMGK